MCKSVCLIHRRFDRESREFCEAVRNELQRRNVPVTIDRAFDVFNFFKRHRTYGVAIGIDFYRDQYSGSGLTLNRVCSRLGREVVCNLSNAIDSVMPEVAWRRFDIVDSYHREWWRFYNHVSARVKAIFYLCTKTNAIDLDVYRTHRDEVVVLFADEIIRCLRSDFDYNNYIQRVRMNNNKRNGRK